jgi:hypothetical protein
MAIISIRLFRWCPVELVEEEILINANTKRIRHALRLCTTLLFDVCVLVTYDGPMHTDVPSILDGNEKLHKDLVVSCCSDNFVVLKAKCDAQVITLRFRESTSSAATTIIPDDVKNCKNTLTTLTRRQLMIRLSRVVADGIQARDSEYKLAAAKVRTKIRKIERRKRADAAEGRARDRESVTARPLENDELGRTIKEAHAWMNNT